MNEVPFFGSDNSLERGLSDSLHPLAFGEELMSNPFDVGVLDDHRVKYVPVAGHRGECDTILVNVHANYCLCVVWRRYGACLVCDRDVESPFVVFVHEFSDSNAPRIRVESVLDSFEVVGTTAKHAFDVVVWLVADSEANISRFVYSEGVSFVVVHPHWIRLINVGKRSPPALIFVVVVRLKLFECFLDEELSRVFHEVGVIHYGVVDVVPVPPFLVESVDLVSDSPSFETAFVQVLRPPLVEG